jgi:hypothetical protein
MIALALIAACMFGGLAVHHYGQRHMIGMAAYRVPTFGTDDLRDWNRELGPKALHAIR